MRKRASAALLTVLFLGIVNPSSLQAQAAASLTAVGPDEGQRIAIHWSGALPAYAVGGSVLESGEFAATTATWPLDAAISRFGMASAPIFSHLAVLDGSGNTLDQVPLASPEDFGWLAEFFGPGRLDPVSAMVVFGDELAVATSDGNMSHQIARWNGQNWRGFGHVHSEQGSIANGSIRSMVVYQGQLLIAGNFTNIDDESFRFIARWDGESWQSLHASGMDDFNAPIHVLAVHDGQLFAGGAFTQVNGTVVNGLARWNGSEWLPLAGPNGTGVGQQGAEVNALAFTGGDLIVGGSFSSAGGIAAQNIARWRNGAWSALPNPLMGSGQGVDRPVAAMSPWQNGLFVAAAQFGAVDQWQWNGLELAPLPFAQGPVSPRFISTLLNVQGELIGIGGFRPFPNIILPTVATARWTGTAWVPLTGNASSEPASGNQNSPGAAATWFDGRLIVGGALRSAGETRLMNLAAWDGVQWGQLEPSGSGLSGHAGRSIQWDGDLVVAGGFEWAGAERVNGVGRWDGARWHPLADQGGQSGVRRNEPFELASISGLHELNGDLVVVGRFDQAGSLPARDIARYDGQSWTAIELPIAGSAFRLGPSHVWESELILAIETLTLMGDLIGTSLLGYDGVQWRLLQAADNPIGFPGGLVRGITDFNGELYVIGLFNEVDGMPINGIARYSGQGWQDVPTPWPWASYQSMAVWNERLIVSGSFSNMSIASWDGSEWEALAGEQSIPLFNVRFVQELRTVGDQLYTRASFSNWQMTRVSAGRWDGDEWALLPGNTGIIGEFEGLPLFSDPFVTQLDTRPAWGLARFRAEPSAIALSGMERPPSWGAEGLMLSYEIEGLLSRPEAGKLTVMSDAGEWCVTSELEVVGERTIRMECFIEFADPGRRSLSARFSASPRHESSLSAPTDAFARWPVELAIVDIDPPGSQRIGQPIQISISISSDGPMPPGGEVEVSLWDDSCRIRLPATQCTLLPTNLGGSWLSAFYFGDDFHQPGSAEAVQYSVLPSTLVFEPLFLDFGSVGIGQTSAEEIVSVGNAAAGPVLVSGLVGADARFTVGTSGTCGPPPFVIPAGGSCTLAFQFSPDDELSRVSEFEIQSNAVDGPHRLILTGSGTEAIFSDRFEAQPAGLR